MLSSGTLNLKFMKRNTNLTTTTKPSASEKADVDKRNNDSVTHAHINRKGKQRQAETKVVYEDSLMGFPVLYGPSGTTGGPCTSSFAGRRSFGNFNTAVEQLGQVSSRPLPSVAIAQQAQQVSQSSRSLESRPSNSAKAKRNSSKAPNNPGESQSKPSTSTSSSNVPSRASREVPISSGFQRPFQNTHIKSNPKKRGTDNESEKDVNELGRSQIKKKLKSQSSDSRKDTKRKSSKDKDSSAASSEDSDAVNREIERMFLECRDS